MLEYVGGRDSKNNCTITVQAMNGRAWSLQPRLDLAHKSPTGFEWGYNGSGPAQTALAILASHLVDPRHHAAVLTVLGVTELPPKDEWLGLDSLGDYLAIRYFQQFKCRVVGRLPSAGWKLTDEDIQRLILETAPRSS